jgi:hypothetical protein
MNEYWKVIVPAVGLFLLVSAYFTSTAISYVGEVVIVNSATEPIKNGHVRVCGQKFQFGALETGKQRAIQYQVRSDSHFELIVEFVSGKTFSKELGYVTSGRDFRHILTVKDDEASIELQ